MKIRIKGNTLRFRLSKSEVAEVALKGKITEQTSFGTNTLIYSVEASANKTMWATFEDGQIVLQIPEALLQNWANSNLVGLDYNMPADNDQPLYLLLEKDFKCIDASPTEDQSDFYDNPEKIC